VPHGAVLHRTVSFVQGVELFSIIFAPPNTVGMWKVCIIFFGKKVYGVLRDHTSEMGGGYEKSMFFRPISRFILETVHDVGHIYVTDHTRQTEVGAPKNHAAP